MSQVCLRGHGASAGAALAGSLRAAVALLDWRFPRDGEGLDDEAPPRGALRMHAQSSEPLQGQRSVYWSRALREARARV